MTTTPLTGEAAAKVARKLVAASKIRYPKSWGRIVNSSVEARYNYLVNIHYIYGIEWGTAVSTAAVVLVVEESGMPVELYHKLVADWAKNWFTVPLYYQIDD